MKRRSTLTSVLTLVLLLTLAVSLALAQGPDPQGELVPQDALGTGFTYQGRLTDGGDPINDSCNLNFKLYDQSGSGGTQIGPDAIKTVTITDGYFAVTDLDFGSDAFTGEARWIEITVRCPAGSGDYVTLEPRQSLTPAPYALALPGLWTQQNDISPNLIGGYSGNWVTSDVSGASVGGGGADWGLNRVTDDFGTVSGGANNQAGDDAGEVGDAPYAVVGGGHFNTASGDSATIAGGNTNAAGPFASVGGGYNNFAPGDSATIAGGNSNAATGVFGDAVGGGYQNVARGGLSTVGGGYQNATNDWFTTVGGGFLNFAGAVTATIGGGEYVSVTGRAATVAGGSHISAAGDYATVGGGRENTADDEASTIGGGWGNTTGLGPGHTVGGGVYNTASGEGYTTVSGGLWNVASGGSATVPGGEQNTAEGYFSFAAGRRAYAINDGAFVWADSNDYPFLSNNTNQFSARATGGARFALAIDGTGLPTWECGVMNGGTWACSSARDLKENLVLVDGTETLERLSQVPIFTWNAKGQSTPVRHIGPMAQDFYAAFDVGQDERHIATIDLDGVALAAIQGLYEHSREQAAHIEELEAQNVAQQQRIDYLEARLVALETASPQSSGILGASWKGLLPGGAIILGLILCGGPACLFW